MFQCQQRAPYLTAFTKLENNPLWKGWHAWQWKRSSCAPLTASNIFSPHVLMMADNFNPMCVIAWSPLLEVESFYPANLVNMKSKSLTPPTTDTLKCYLMSNSYDFCLDDQCREPKKPKMGTYGETKSSVFPRYIEFDQEVECSEDITIKRSRLQSRYIPTLEKHPIYYLLSCSDRALLTANRIASGTALICNNPKCLSSSRCLASNNWQNPLQCPTLLSQTAND